MACHGEKLKQQGLPVVPGPLRRERRVGRQPEEAVGVDVGVPEAGTECILCGGCADVCPEDCIEFVPLAEIGADPALREAAVAELGDDGAALFEPGAAGTALIKDETVCIRCGLCAERCPAGTITMESFELEEVADG